MQINEKSLNELKNMLACIYLKLENSDPVPRFTEEMVQHIKTEIEGPENLKEKSGKIKPAKFNFVK